MVFVPPNAPLVVLAFLGTALLVVAGAVAGFFGLLSHRRWLLLGGVAVAFGAGALYAAVWLGSSLLSRERVLSLGERKYFCEIDCHIAYSVTRVERVPATPGGGSGGAAPGTRLAVTLRTWFDPETISARRGVARPLSPNPREIFVKDAACRRYPPLVAEARALAAARGAVSADLGTPLRPGESYETLLLFEVPVEAPQPRLYVGNVFAESAFLIGHEAAPLHAKNWFAL